MSNYISLFFECSYEKFRSLCFLLYSDFCERIVLLKSFPIGFAANFIFATDKKDPSNKAAYWPVLFFLSFFHWINPILQRGFPCNRFNAAIQKNRQKNFFADNKSFSFFRLSFQSNGKGSIKIIVLCLRAVTYLLLSAKCIQFFSIATLLSWKEKTF
jgi:hypothetical protein